MKTPLSGFTLLEAIVAMVILSTSGVALYSWLSTSLEGLIRVDEIIEINEVMDDLDAYFSTLNLQEEADRTFRVNGHDVTWQAKLVESKQRGRTMTGQLSYYDLGLYDVDVRILKDAHLLGEYQTRLVGYQRTRGPKPEAP